MTEPSRTTHPMVMLTAVRLKLMLREPEMLFWVFVFPVLMALALGIAFQNREDEPMTVAVRNGAAANALVTTLAATDELEVITARETDELGLLRDGRAHLIVIPGSPVTYRFDPARPESRLTRLLVDQALSDTTDRRHGSEARIEEVSTPGSRYIDWLVPGLLGMNIMGSGMWGVGFAIVVARSRKLLKRMVATPMRRSHFLASLVLARLAFLGLEMLALLGVAWWAFGVGIEGSVAGLIGVALAGSLSFGGIGLLTASRARTIEGVSGIMNIVMMPMWVCSGVFFAVTNFPDAAQPFIRLLPLTALIDALRGVMLNGESMLGVGPELGLMVVWGTGTFLLAVRTFRWQ